MVNVILGKDLFINVDIYTAKEHFGSDYGGWDIVIDHINQGSVVYSFGVGEDTTFDLALMERFHLSVDAFDPTPKSIDWVHKQNFPASFCFHEYGIADVDGELPFYPPENPEFVSHTILNKSATYGRAINLPVKRLPTIMKDLGHDRIDILKMDIEGAEYSVLEDIENSDIRPQQILVEFHHRFPGVSVQRTKDAIKRIRVMGYVLFSISPRGEEYCFMMACE